MNLKRLGRSFIYALRGLERAFKEEQNLQIQSIIAIITVLAGFFFGITALEWSLLVFVIGLVFLMELANSAVERISDVLKPRIHNYVKEIKDIMAAAVMLSALVALIVGLIIFIPYLFGIWNIDFRI